MGYNLRRLYVFNENLPNYFTEGALCPNPTEMTLALVDPERSLKNVVNRRGKTSKF